MEKENKTNCKPFKEYFGEENKQGCGKEFMWIKHLNDKRVCGQFEDLKHSDHIILCPDCATENKSKGIVDNLNDERVATLKENKECALMGCKDVISQSLGEVIEDKTNDKDIILQAKLLLRMGFAKKDYFCQGCFWK